MKNKGFTLVELLAVIVILGILLSISTVSVNSIKKKQDEKNLQNVISSILTGAKEYNAKNRIPVSNNDNKNSISVADLKSGDYVDFDEDKYSNLLGNYVTKNQCSNALKVKYSIEVDGTIYNDCGCEEQIDGKESKEICMEKN